jgi:23S rRNA pseudouridine2605 synthase
MRINKYLAQCNISSRRKVEEFITSGKVMINDVVITDLSTQVVPTDIVKFNGVVVKPSNVKLYFLLNKPIGYITTVSDEQGRHTVLDLIERTPERIFPVGRLDCNTEGMLILTNDGDFANKLIHPSKEIDKVYEVVVTKQPSIDQFAQLEKGVVIDDFLTSPSKISAKQKLEFGSFKFNITIHEGKNRQVRKMMQAVGLKVKALKRVKIGALPLGNLPTGKYRKLTKQELELLLKNGGK